MGLQPWEFERWTLRELFNAYAGWRQVHIDGPWERARAISFYSVAPHDSKGRFKRWSDLFPLLSDDNQGRVRKKHRAVITLPTEEEKRLFKLITSGQQLTDKTRSLN